MSHREVCRYRSRSNAISAVVNVSRLMCSTRAAIDRQRRLRRGHMDGPARHYHQPMLPTVTQAGLLAAELEARGFLAGVGKFILFVIIFLVVIGGLIGFSVARRFGGRR